MPILGVIASSTRQGQATDTGSVFPISNVVVGSAGSSSVTFSSIPSTYTHLQIRCVVRDNRSDVLSSLGVRFNGDTGGNYAYHNFRADGTNLTNAEQGASVNRIELDRYLAAASSPSGTFAGIILDIPDYASANKYKTLKAIGGVDNASAGTGVIEFSSGLWLNTNAITSITLYSIYGTLVENTRFSLYGYKGA